MLPFWLICPAKSGHCRIKAIEPIQLVPRLWDWSPKDSVSQKLTEEKVVSDYFAGSSSISCSALGVQSAKNDPFPCGLSPLKLENPSSPDALFACWATTYIGLKAKGCSVNVCHPVCTEEGKKS